MIADISFLQGKIVDQPEKRIEQMPALIDQITAEILKLQEEDSAWVGSSNE